MTSGTIYHFVIQPSGANPLGAGSISTFHTNSISGTPTFQTKLISAGSVFNCAQDDNILGLYSNDAGTTWNPFTGQLASAGQAFLLLGTGTGTYQDSQTMGIGPQVAVNSHSVGGSSLGGYNYAMNNTYDVSGVFVYIANAGANAGGSLWCRLEYSGVMIGGLRGEVGSAVIYPITANSWNSTQFYTKFNAGSNYYLWFYAPSGTGNQPGSRYNPVLSNTSNQPFTMTFASPSSGLSVNSTDAGSTVNSTGTQDGCIYFAISGGTGGITAVEEPQSINNLYNSIINYV